MLLFPGDTVTYGEIVDFLVEFDVIPSQRICTERQITAIVQASFPKVITKPSAKYSVLFVNLENRSDDVVKEELVRVTTEPIIDPASREAQQWIKEADEENYDEDDQEDEELTKIENEKDRQTIKPMQQNGKNKEEYSSNSSDQDSGTETPRNGMYNGEENEEEGEQEELEEVQERAVDVCFERSPRFNENLQNNKLISKSTGDVRSSSGLKRVSSFSNKNMNRSVSVVDVAKKFDDSSSAEDVTDKGVTRSTSSTNLQRKRSFTRSTDRSFVGSIRDRFRASLRKKSNDKDGESNERNAKVVKKEEAKVDSGKNADKKDSSSSKRVTSKASFRVDNNSSNTSSANSNNDARTSVIKKGSNRNGGSSVDLRDTGKHKEATVNKNFSSSSTDVRASFRTNSSRSNTGTNRDQEVRATYRSNSTRQSTKRSSSDVNNNDATEKSFVRSTAGRNASHGSDVRSSVRRSNNNSSNDIRASVRKSGNNDKDTTSKTTIRVSSTSSTTTVRSSTVRASLRENKKGTGIRRSNSRAGATPRGQASTNSSAQSTPTVSRENSKTNLKIPVRRRTNSSNKIDTSDNRNKNSVSQQEKDILRIAKAFQQASDEISASKDNIEKFMTTIAIDDIEPCTNNRINIDDLYDHIRHRMIVSKSEIFEGYRSDVRLDMSEYFDLLFTTLASHMNRIGCEIVTDSTTQEKICYLTHVKLVGYQGNNDVEKMEKEQSDDNNDDDDEDAQASYV